MADLDFTVSPRTRRALLSFGRAGTSYTSESESKASFSASEWRVAVGEYDPDRDRWEDDLDFSDGLRTRSRRLGSFGLREKEGKQSGGDGGGGGGGGGAMVVVV